MWARASSSRRRNQASCTASNTRVERTRNLKRSKAGSRATIGASSSSAWRRSEGATSVASRFSLRFSASLATVNISTPITIRKRMPGPASPPPPRPPLPPPPPDHPGESGGLEDDEELDELDELLDEPEDPLLP